MKKEYLTLAHIRQLGTEVLMRELGPVGMIRFFQQFELGSGDYSKDRKEILKDESVESLSEKIIKQRNS
ncbi:MAG: hypothetical protein GY754_40645 [bacterium]|nr:hypothetical protein [bacterium]